MSAPSIFSSYPVDNALRFDKAPEIFRSEIYILNDQLKKIFPLHPADFTSENKLVLKNIPNADEWKTIRQIFKCTDDYSYCKYLVRVNKSQIFFVNQEWENLLLGSGGYSKARLSEIDSVASLSGAMLRLFNEKKIPVKYLILLSQQEMSLTEKFTDYLLFPEINSNTCRDLIQMWVDLSSEKQSRTLEKFKTIRETLHVDHKARVGDKLKKTLYAVRYPDYQKRLDSIENKIKDFSGKILIEYDPLLEKQYFDIKIRIKSHADIENLKNLVTQDNTVQTLAEIQDLLNEK